MARCHHLKLQVGRSRNDYADFNPNDVSLFDLCAFVFIFSAMIFKTDLKEEYYRI